jgi:GDPmannose 4,6-dehydratase
MSSEKSAYYWCYWTGRLGSYLAEYLIDLGYEVHGTKRRSSSFNTDRIDHIFSDPHDSIQQLQLHYADVTDFASINKLIADLSPDEVYNLAAQSHTVLPV